jgi:hypothetical protein
MTDETCTQTCSAGYSDNNNGAGQTYTCPDGELLGTLIVCTPDACSGYSTSAGVNSECDSLVTDGSCTQTCAAGYTSNGGGVHTCPAGVFEGTTLTCTAITCSENYHVSDHACVSCASGTTNAAGDNASGDDTTCDITYCAENYYVSNHVCEACAPGTTNAAGDDASGGGTSCDTTYCASNYYISSPACVACPAGTTNAAGDAASGGDTSCDTTYCAANYYVSSHTCVACPAGTTNAANDDASGGDTSCDATTCSANYHVSNHECVACSSGYENEAGDDASGGDTSCYQSTYTVTCTFTIDNYASHVYVNGVEMSVDGDMNSWSVGKTFSFEDGTINGETYIIAIDGYNAEDCDGTTCSAGFMIGCSSTWADSVWNDVYSSTSDDRFLTVSESWGDVMPPEWVEEDFQCNSNQWGLPVVSTSTFTCSACQEMHASAQAVWAVRNLQYGWFRISVPYAQELTPSTTGRGDDD